MILGVGCLLSGCDGIQSTLDPGGREAEQIATLFWWMVGGAAVIWTAVLALGLYASRCQPPPQGRRAGWLIIGGGAVVPTVVLAGLLAYGLALLPELLTPAPPGSLVIAASGEQWWWRFRYRSAGEPQGESEPDAVTVQPAVTDAASAETLASAEIFEIANELHLPVGQPVEFHLESADVIHSFWIPSLGGKMDMFPGRTTRLTLHPTEVGVYRGACAEYCGGSHALMNFYVVVEEPEEFARWLEQQSQPAVDPTAPLAVQGRDLFLASGCGGCHTVRGTAADGLVGPDLTHVGSRLSIGAGILPSEPDAFYRWIAETEELKPEVHMPAFGMLPAEQLRALAACLEALK